MTPAEIREEIIDILEDIAPDEDLSDLKDDVPEIAGLRLDEFGFDRGRCIAGGGLRFGLWLLVFVLCRLAAPL